MSFSFALAIVVVVALGGVGAFLGHRLPIPAGVLLGTIVGAAIGSGLSTLIELPQLSVPSLATKALQVLLGMLVGFRMSREALRPGAHALVPSLLLVVIIIPTAIVSALVVAPLTSFDTVTLVFAAAPGGVTEMTTVSLGFGADGAAVATLQFVRVLLAVAIVGVVVRYSAKGGATSSEEDGDEQDSAPDEEAGLLEDVKRLGMAAPWGILGGVIGLITSLPAAGIIGALVGTTAFRLITDRTVPTTKYQHGVQMLSGGVIGIEISGRFFSELLMLAVVGAVIISVQMLLWLATSWMLTKFFGYNISTAALASSPGGISGVVPAANEAGADVAIVSFMQLTRLGTIVAVVPVFVSLSFGG